MTPREKSPTIRSRCPSPFSPADGSADDCRPLRPQRETATCRHFSNGSDGTRTRNPRRDRAAASIDCSRGQIKRGEGGMRRVAKRGEMATTRQRATGSRTRPCCSGRQLAGRLRPGRAWWRASEAVAVRGDPFGGYGGLGAFLKSRGGGRLMRAWLNRAASLASRVAAPRRVCGPVRPWRDARYWIIARAIRKVTYH